MNNVYPHFTSKQQIALNNSLRKAIIMERIYWTISAFCVIAFAALLTGCGGNSQNNDESEADKQASECRTFVGPVIPGSICWLYQEQHK